MSNVVLSDFPDEVLLEILRFVNPHDLIFSITYLSRKFSSIVWSEDGRLWLLHLDSILSSSSSSSSSSLAKDEDSSEKEEEYSSFPSARIDRRIEAVKVLNPHQICRLCLHHEAVTMMRKRTTNNNTHNSSFLLKWRNVSILVSQNEAMEISRHPSQKRVCLASTTDHDREQIEFVLPFIDSNRIRTMKQRKNTIQHSFFPFYFMDDTIEHQQNGINNVAGAAGAAAGGDPSLGLGFSVLFGERYWSSAASTSGHPGVSDEVLVFVTSCPLAVVSEIDIKPFTERIPQFFRDEHDESSKTYTWPKISVEVYDFPLEQKGLKQEQQEQQEQQDDGVITFHRGFPCMISSASWSESQTRRNITMRDKISSLLQSRHPVYRSSITESQCSTNRLSEVMCEKYTLPPGVIGNVVVIHLVGKDRRQFSESGYYVCVDHVSVKGIPLLEHVEEFEDAVHSKVSSAKMRKNLISRFQGWWSSGEEHEES